jgi:hypothetical protein
MRTLLALAAFFTLSLPTLAQTDRDFPLEVPITLGTMVGDTITEEALYDWWVVYLNEGDTILIEMQGYDGLAPLIGVLDDSRQAIARSDDEGDAEVNGMTTLEFRAEAAGEYRIVASRAGASAGTTTGTYTLLATLISSIPPRENLAPETQFRCDTLLINNALSLHFAEDVVIPENLPPGAPIESYVITVASFDTFEPAVRVVSETLGAQLDCTRDASQMPGVTFTIPGQPSLTVSDTAYAAQVAAISTAPDILLGDLVFTVGGLEGTRGRFVVLLQGRSIANRRAADILNVRLGPRARNSTLTVYMIADKDSRLDPHLTLLDANGAALMACDDAGARDCADVPSARGLRITDVNGSVILEGGRYDAGLIFQPNSAEPFSLYLSSRNYDTTGAYSVLIIAEFE